MQFSVDWLNQYLQAPAETDRLAERLTAVGLAVEGREAVGGDTLLDIDVGTNRPDCMSYVGLAREAALALGTPLQPPSVEAPERSRPSEEAVRIRIDPTAAEACPRYVGLLIEGVKVGPSPEWLQERLRTIGSRPINNVVDVTNFVLWETGQPLHAFDRDRLKGRRIVVRFARPGETLTTLDSASRKLNEETLVIADEEDAVALAGVMGGLESEVSATTTNVLLESAHFAPTAVRRGAVRLGLHTDASHRFERGADPEVCLSAALRAAAMIQQIGGGNVYAALVVDSGKLPPTLHGELSVSRLGRFAGLEVSHGDVVRILGALGFMPEGGESEDRVRITVPSWRYYDFAQTAPDGAVWFADIADEVMRHVGFESIPAEVAAAQGPDAESAPSYRRRRRVQDRLSASGYLEAFNYAFLSESESEAFDTLLDGEPLRLANPISERYELMRRSLLPGLLESALYNLRRDAAGVQLFEVGHLFASPADGEVVEREAIGLVGGGMSALPWDGGRDVELTDVKGAIESLAAEFGVELEARPQTRRGLEPGTSGIWTLAGGSEPVGQFGRLSGHAEQVALFAAELLAGDLPAEIPVGTVRIPSRFPAVIMDLTLTHSLSVSWAELTEAIEALRPSLLADYHLKVRYRGEGVPDGAVATTISLVYQSDERSLTQDEVNEQHLGLLNELERRFGERGKEGGE